MKKTDRLNAITAFMRGDEPRYVEDVKVSQELVRARKRAGLSQTQVARLMGVKPPLISRLESIARGPSPTLDSLRRYAAAVGCTVIVVIRPRQKQRAALGIAKQFEIGLDIANPMSLF